MTERLRRAQAQRAPRCGGRPTTIKSLATYVPPRVLTNADLEKLVDTNDEWILQRTGIRERHIVDAGVEKRPHDAREKRVAVTGRKRRLGAPHPGRSAGREDDGGDHGRHVIESRP